MTQKASKQILAIGCLVGFLGISACVILGFGNGKVDLVFGAWVGLVTKVMSDYFGEKVE